MGFRPQDFRHLRARGAPVAPPARAERYTSTHTARKRQRRCAATAQPARRVILAEAGRLVVEVFVRTVSELNRAGHESHWTTAARRKSQRQAFAMCMAGLALPPLPARVTLTRRGVRLLDENTNLHASMKAIADELASMFGVDDASPLYRWEVKQERSKVQSVIVDIESVKA